MRDQDGQPASSGMSNAGSSVGVGDRNTACGSWGPLQMNPVDKQWLPCTCGCDQAGPSAQCWSWMPFNGLNQHLQMTHKTGAVLIRKKPFSRDH